MNDVTEGVSGFINEGNVGALVQNVTFGLSNSAAKVTGSLSDGLGRVTMDERHEEVPQYFIIIKANFEKNYQSTKGFFNFIIEII